MYKISALLALLFISLTGLAQNRTIKGYVIDSATNVPVELATIAVLSVKDTTSTLISYTLTDKKGGFTLHGLPTGIPLKILVSFVSYNSYRRFFTLTKTDLDLGKVKVTPRQLHEIMIKGERPPVVIRADTIEFAAEAFKVRPNALVEDLLKKLPGVEVARDGSISVNGKDVSKVLVDNHEFFNNDYRIATKNLDADMIDKVQVYDDRENDPDHLAPDQNVKKIINLKFKKAYKKSIFGKFYAGAGTESRYESAGLLNMFRDTLQVSILGGSNNLNNTGFSFNDLYTSGGLNRGGGAFNGAAGFGIAGSSGIQKIISGGVNINNDYGKKLKINLAYYYSRTVNTYNSLTNTQRLLNDTDLVTNVMNTRLSVDNRHNITSLVKWQPDPKTQITYTPTISFSDNSSGTNAAGNTFSNFISKINQSTVADNNTGNNMQFQHSFSYNRKLHKPGESISISHSLQFNPSNGNDYNINNLTSYSTLVPSYLLDRYANTVGKNSGGNLSVLYLYPITKKISFDITATSDYRHQINNTFTYDFDPLTNQYSVFDQNVSSALTRNLWTQNLTSDLIYHIKPGIELSAGFNSEFLQVNNHFDRNVNDIDKHYFELLPNFNLSIKKFAFSYQSGFTLPNISDMIPYSIVYSPLSTVTGNPNLKPAKRNNFSLSYNTFNTQTQTNVRLNATAFFDQNGVFRERTLNEAGAETSMPINMSGRYGYTLNGSLSKRLKKGDDFSLSAQTTVALSQNHTFFELNGQNGYQDSYSASFNELLTFNWKDKFEFLPSYRFTGTATSYTGINYNNQNNISHIADTHFIYYWTKSTSAEGTYTYTYNPLVPPGFQKSTNLVNVNIAHTLLGHDRGQIKLTCYDLLNQNIGSSRRIVENTITDTQSQILKRYFLLTLQYKFNKTLSKK